MFVIPQVGKVIQRAARWPQLITTLVIFFVLLIFAFISYQNAQQTLRFQKSRVIEQKLSAAEDAIKGRMDENGNMALAGAAFFDGSETLSNDEWGRFYAKLEVEDRYDGITSIGFSPIVKPEDKVLFERTLHEQGVPSNLGITPSGDRELYTPVMLMQSYKDADGVYGFDMYDNPKRRAAMEYARDTGKVAITDSLELVVTDSLGIVLYAPVYIRNMPTNTVDERRAAVKGYIFTGVKVQNLLSHVLPEDDRENLGIVVSEMQSDGLPKEIYNTLDENKAEGLQRVSSSDIDLYGKKWRLNLYANDHIVSSTERERPATILAGGVAISLIASLAVFLLIQYRTRTFALAEEYKLQQAKDELLSLASHQLRTPATGVKQYVGMVLEGFGGKVSDEQMALLQQAYKSNERQLQIINEFLYVAKLDSGSLTTSVHLFDLVPVVKDVLREMRPDIDERKHKLTVRMPKSVKMHADEHSLRMVIENLISNAVKYTKPGGKITINLSQKNKEIIFRVEDTGIGISKRDMELLFKQFSRIPNELSGVVSGSGIGLYLAQQLAERNNGRIEVDSEEGRGSVFTLHIANKSVRKITKD